MGGRGWLAADFEADVADGFFQLTIKQLTIGFLVGGRGWLAADFETDVADGLLVGELI